MFPLGVAHVDQPHPVDDLAGLRQFLNRLETRYLRLRRNQIDVTKDEVRNLKLEIARLERILLWEQSKSVCGQKQ
jgi:hypothetical protein